MYCNQPRYYSLLASISLQGLDGRSLMYTLYSSGRFGVEKESSLIMPNIYLHTAEPSLRVWVDCSVNLEQWSRLAM